jgi:hypothetical protein
LRQDAAGSAQARRICRHPWRRQGAAMVTGQTITVDGGLTL